MNKIGLGQDSHRFSKEKKPLILGGIKISLSGGLEANSDGDVILHSLCNALSSAMGGDSLGTWADQMYFKGIKDSKRYVEYILEKIKNKKLKIENIAISVEAQKPKLTLEEISLIKNSVANLLKINAEQIGITFTSGEGLTAFGRGEGIQVLTVVNLNES